MIIILAGSIYASFDVGTLSYKIDKSYSIGENVRGWINISLDEENANSILESSLGDSIKLIDFLKINEENYEIEYNCTPKSCKIGYSATLGEKTKTFALKQGESKIVGLKFNGEIESIDSVNFSVQSDADSSCVNQLQIDILDDGIIDYGNNKALSESCASSKSYGCYDSSKGVEEYNLKNGNIYCQKITLSESPGFKIGTWIKKISEGTGTQKVTLFLYNSEGSEIEGASCDLSEITASGAETSCSVDYLVTKQKDYYVCTSANGNAEYKIRGNSNPSSKCGFFGEPIKTTTGAYQFFAEGKKFAQAGTISINNNLPSGDTINELFQEYIGENYGEDMDCLDGCVVPIKFISRKDQTIILKNLNSEYEKPEATTAEEFYTLTTSSVKVNSEFLKLYLEDSNFSVPSEIGESTFSLELNGEEILSEEIDILKVAGITSLTPRSTVASLPTTFTVNVSTVNNKSITKYEWFFGDQKNATTTSNSASHTYGEIGLYDLKITITDNDSVKSSKVFQIYVGSPKQVANITLKKKLDDLVRVKAQLNGLPDFYKSIVDSVLNITDSEDKIKKIQQAYASAKTDSDYSEVLDQLIKLNIPKSINRNEISDPIPFYPQSEAIDLGILQEIGTGSIEDGSEEEYENAIGTWNYENLNPKVTYEDIEVVYGYGSEPLLKVFGLSLEEKGTIGYDYYVIIKSLENLKFKQDYFEQEKNGYYYIRIGESSEKNIAFSTSEDVDLTDLPLFISPDLNKLPVSISRPSNPIKSKLWVLILAVFLLIIIAIIAYIALQIWYKKRYESFLFKNRNDLYNIMTYINNSKKQGLDERKIEQNLKKSGWKNEQVDYALKKYSGKKTGMMYEIPIEKVTNVVNKEENKEKPTEKKPIIFFKNPFKKADKK